MIITALVVVFSLAAFVKNCVRKKYNRDTDFVLVFLSIALRTVSAILILTVATAIFTPKSEFSYALTEERDIVPFKYDLDGITTNLIFNGKTYQYVYRDKRGSINRESAAKENTLAVHDSLPAKVRIYKPIGFHNWATYIYAFPFVLDRVYEFYAPDGTILHIDDSVTTS